MPRSPGPIHRRPPAVRLHGFGQAKDAEAGAEAQFRIGFATQDDVDQDLGIGPVGCGVATDAGWGSTGVTTVCGGHMLGHGGVA